MKTVYVISDLHLGGDNKMAQQRNPRQLVDFVQKTAASDGNMLVINGDVVDFLLERDGMGFLDLRRTQQDACACLRAIFARDGVKEVMDALRDFARKPGRELVLLPGNHDIELLYPRVERLMRGRLLLDELPQDDEDITWNNIELSKHVWLHATYEPLTLGEVVLVHGNMNDPHNRIDHKTLLKDRKAMTDEHTHRANVASPYGSRLVQKVINPAKDLGCSFIDQLKPEIAAALIASVLHKELRPLLRPALSLLIRGQLSNNNKRFRSTDPALGRSPDPEVIAEVQGWAEELGKSRSTTLTNDLLSDIPAYMVEPDPIPRGPADRESRGEQENRERFVDQMWEKLAWKIVCRYVDDHTFTLSPPKNSWRDDASINYAQFLYNKFKNPSFILMGHTHLARNLKLSKEGCQYINTGTWVHVLSLPHSIKENFVEFEQFLNILNGPNSPAHSSAHYAKIIFSDIDMSIIKQVTLNAL
jgi:UDP-2,3-diacylglucosamine pyrophosphatase LpxH